MTNQTLVQQSYKILQIILQKFYNLYFTSSPENQFFPTIPHTFFSNKYTTTFIFFEFFTDDKPDTCAAIIQNSTNHTATLPTGYIGYIEVPITNEKTEHYQVNDIKTLVHNVFHKTILILQNLSHRQITLHNTTLNELLPNIFTTLSLHDRIYDKTFSLYNVQPTSHTSKPRLVTSLPYTQANLKFNKKFNFQFSDFTDTEDITLCALLLKSKTCYATHKNDVGIIATPFRIGLKRNAQLIRQRPSKITIHYRDQLNTLPKELEKKNLIKQNGFNGTTCLNLLVIKPKRDSINCVLDTRHLSCKTE